MTQITSTIPTAVRWAIGILSALLLLSGIGAAVASQVIPPKPAWALTGFEVVVAFSSFFGLMVFAGRVRQAPALAVLCVAGATLVGSVLGYLAVKVSLAHLPLKPWLAARLGVVGLLTLCAIVIALGSNRQAWNVLVKAALFAVPLAGVALWYRLAHLAPLDTPMPGFKDALRLAAIAGVATTCAVCVCAVTHLSVRAFAIADEPDIKA